MFRTARFLLLLAGTFALQSVAAQLVRPAAESTDGEAIRGLDDRRGYVQISAGWSIPVSNANNGSPLEPVGDLDVFDDGTNQRISRPLNTRGGGFKLRVDAGYRITDHIAAEMGVHVLRSTRVLDARQDRLVDGDPYFAEQESWSAFMSISPSIRLEGDRTKKVVPFMRIGVLMPVVGYTFSEVAVQDGTGRVARDVLPVIDPAFESLVNTLDLPSNSRIQSRTSGRFSVGFTASAGVMVPINEWLSFTAEAGFDMLSIKAKSTEVLEFFAGDAEGNFVEFTEEDIPPFLQQTTYVETLTETSNDSYDINDPQFRRDEPREDVVFRSNYNNAYLIVGTSFSF